MTCRRQFLKFIPIAGSSLLASRLAFAADVDPKEAQAAALGYVTDASKADKAKFPKYAAGQTCGGCSLYQGKASDPTAPCPIFAGKNVAGKGWCSAYAKRA